MKHSCKGRKRQTLNGRSSASHGRGRPLRPVVLTLLVLASVAPAAVAQPAATGEAETTEVPATAPEAGPKVPASMRSPRAVLTEFLQRIRADQKKEAAELLDLSALNAATSESRGPDLAYKLYAAMQRLVRLPASEEGDIDDLFTALTNNEAALTLVPNSDSYAEPWKLSEWTEQTDPQAAQIVIAQNPETKVWKFSQQTVAAIDSLYESLETKEVIAKPTGGDEPTETFGILLRNAFPQSLRTTYFLLPTYQWLLLLALAPLGRFAEKLSRQVLTAIADTVLRRYDPEFFSSTDTSRRVWRPMGRLANAAVWVIGAYLIELPVHVTDVLLVVLLFVAIVMAILAVFRIIDLVSDYFVRRAKRSQRKFDDLLVPLAASTIKIVAALFGVLATVAAFNSELPSALLGGLGIGGIAIALASQETLSNFIGSITVLFDRPFEVGDWVKVDGVEGEIESLGFRSTRIRTGMNSQVTLPNSKLASSSVDNWGRRKYRRYLNKLGLEYGTSPERIEAFCEGIREIIRRQPHTRKDFYAANFNDFGASSLDIIVVVFFEVPDWATELRERHRLLADILRLAEELGIGFAFPTQTVHLQREVDTAAPPDLPNEDPEITGARAGAKIAGELPNYQDRPGKVKFPGPTPLGSRPPG